MRGVTYLAKLKLNSNFLSCPFDCPPVPDRDGGSFGNSLGGGGGGRSSLEKKSLKFRNVIIQIIFNIQRPQNTTTGEIKHKADEHLSNLDFIQDL